MANFGRYFCVAIPFLMTLASLVALLIAGLGGVTDKSLFMFEVNSTNLTISASDVSNLLSSRSVGTPVVLDARQATPPVGFHDPALLGGTTTGSGSSPSSTAASGSVRGQDLGVFALYDVALWGYCYTQFNGTRECTKTAFNWADNALNQTTANVNSMITATGKNVTLSKDIIDGVHTFVTVSKWTQIVFVIAAASLGVELFFGFLANCSRVFSCIAWLVAGFAATAVCAFAALATVTATVIVGILEGTAKKYGVSGSFNTRFLAVVWISAAFAIASGMFWIFTCCCCAPDHHSRSRRSRDREMHGDREKLVPAGAYVPIQGDHGYNGAYGNKQFHYASGANAPAGHRDLAYEPYAHHANV